MRAGLQSRHTIDTVRPRSTYHPAFDRPVRVAAAPRLGNDEQRTAQTVNLMRELAREDSRSPIVRQTVFEILRNTTPHSEEAHTPREKADAIFGWIKRRVRFVNDAVLAGPISREPFSAEVLIRPVDVLTMPQPQGDCATFSTLCAAMLRSLGIDSGFKTVEADSDFPGQYSHVYVLAELPEGALALDCSHGAYPGWEVRPTGKSRLWPVEENAMKTLGAIDWGALVKTGVDIR